MKKFGVFKVALVLVLLFTMLFPPTFVAYADDNGDSDPGSTEDTQVGDSTEANDDSPESDSVSKEQDSIGIDDANDESVTPIEVEAELDADIVVAGDEAEAESEEVAPPSDVTSDASDQDSISAGESEAVVNVEAESDASSAENEATSDGLVETGAETVLGDVQDEMTIEVDGESVGEAETQQPSVVETETNSIVAQDSENADSELDDQVTDIDAETNSIEDLDNTVADAETAEGESVAEIVVSMDENGVVLVDEDGVVEPLATEEAEVALANADPYIERQGTTYRFLPLGGCAAFGGVSQTCAESTTPVQDAIDFAQADETINIEAGTAPEDITVSTDNLTLKKVDANVLMNSITIDALNLITNGILTNVVNVTNNATIQNGIDVVSDGGTVNVAAGTYDEGGITIDKSVNITGDDPTTTHVKSANVPVFTVSNDNVTIEDLEITHDTVLSEAIRVDGATENLTVENVQFTNLGPATPGANAFGINILNSFSDLTVKDCRFDATGLGEYTRVIGIFVPEGKGNQLQNFMIDNNVFTNHFVGVYLRTEINGLDIRNNTFGPQEIADCRACAAGVYIGDGDPGFFNLNNISLTDNTFTNYCRGLYSWNYATGERTDKVDITGNTFTNSIYSSPIRFIGRLNTTDVSTLEGPINISNNNFTQNVNVGGTYSLAWVDIRAGLESATSQLNITNNDFDFNGPYTNAAYGIRLQGPVTQATISGNTLAGNNAGGTVGGPPDTTAINLISNGGFGSTPATAVINVNNNDISGFVNGVTVYDSDGGTNGGLTAGASLLINNNTFVANINGVVSGTGEVTNAENNWWGAADGPSGSGPGTGDSVSDNVDYDPWLVADPNAPPVPPAPDGGGNGDDGDDGDGLGTPPPAPITPAAIIPVTGGELVTLGNTPTTLELPDGNTATFNGSSGESVTIVGEAQDTLPDELPTGNNFVAGMTTNVFAGFSALATLPAGETITLSFDIPAGMEGETFVVLFWDATANGGLGGWVEAGGEVVGGQIVLTVGFAGTFVLVTN